MTKQISTKREILPSPIITSGFHSRNVLLIISIVLLLVVMLRFDFIYSGKSQEVKSGDTLWGYLESEVFQHAGVTRVSISYLKKQGVDVDLILRNKDSEGGDSVSVKNNYLIIAGPSDQVRVNAQVLPDFALRNHLYQVIAYDLVILVVFLYLGILLYDLFKTRDIKIIYEQVGIILIITLLIPLLLVVISIVFGNIYFRFFYFTSLLNKLPDGSSGVYQVPADNFIRKSQTILVEPSGNRNYAEPDTIQLPIIDASNSGDRILDDHENVGDSWVEFQNSVGVYLTIIPVLDLQKKPLETQINN